MPKIAMIGAGSVVFAKTLMADILQCPELADSTIALMDIDPERLGVAEGLARKIVRQLGVPATIEASLDRHKALRQADYVICMIQVGGFEATLRDFDIPEKYGLKQTIGDTLGVGGIMRALRTIPVLVAIARDMERLCPNALLLNYSNPMAMNIWGIYRGSGVRVVGLCHSVQGTIRRLAHYVDVPPEQVRFRCGGLNHMNWVLTFSRDGEDLYPRLLRAMDNLEIYSRDKVRFEILRRFGWFVTESSEHMAEYVPYFIPHESLIETLDIPVREYVHRCEQILDVYEKHKALAGNPEPLELHRSSEYCSQIIHSIATGQPRVIYGNVQNRGLIPNLPAECCVEVPCLVDRNGMQPCYVGDLPPQLAALNRANVSVQELAVRAALEKRRDYAYHACLLDPNAAAVLTMDQIVAMVDDLIAAHGRDLAYLA